MSVAIKPRSQSNRRQKVIHRQNNSWGGDRFCTEVLFVLIRSHCPRKCNNSKSRNCEIPRTREATLRGLAFFLTGPTLSECLFGGTSVSAEDSLASTFANPRDSARSSTLMNDQSCPDESTVTIHCCCSYSPVQIESCICRGSPYGQEISICVELSDARALDAFALKDNCYHLCELCQPRPYSPLTGPSCRNRYEREEDGGGVSVEILCL